MPTETKDTATAEWKRLSPSQRLWSNIEFIWESSDGKKNSSKSFFLDKLGISRATYNNYKHNKIKSGNLRSLSAVCEGLNGWIGSDAALRELFPDGISENEVTAVDLRARARKKSDLPYSPSKILGKYLCYYMSSSRDAPSSKRLRYGVIHIFADTKHAGEYRCRAVLSLKAPDDALEIYASDDAEVSGKPGAHRLFTGQAYIKLNLIWLHLVSPGGNEFISASFDLPPRVMEASSNRSFKGVRGIALSQTLGADSHTSVFPIAIKKGRIMRSENEIRDNLRFIPKNISGDSSAVLELTDDLIRLYESLSYLPEIRRDMLAVLLSNRLQALLNSEVYNSFHYTAAQIDSFYHDIIEPEQ